MLRHSPRRVPLQPIWGQVPAQAPPGICAQCGEGADLGESLLCEACERRTEPAGAADVGVTSRQLLGTLSRAHAATPCLHGQAAIVDDREFFLGVD